MLEQLSNTDKDSLAWLKTEESLAILGTLKEGGSYESLFFDGDGNEPLY